MNLMRLCYHLTIIEDVQQNLLEALGVSNDKAGDLVCNMVGYLQTQGLSVLLELVKVEHSEARSLGRLLQGAPSMHSHLRATGPLPTASQAHILRTPTTQRPPAGASELHGGLQSPWQPQ